MVLLGASNLTVGLDEVVRIASARLGGPLEVLGAPLYVYEYEEQGAILVWGRGRADDKGFNVSVPVSDQGGSADFDYSRLSAKTRGVLMVFDPDWRLAITREGLVRDLTEGLGTRPTPPLRREDDE